MDFKINQFEQNSLKGLPHLPRLVYLEALRPYMDFATGIVGIKRGVSYQSLSEELYVEPHPGYESGSPSRQQLRRAIKTLEHAGLITIQSIGKKLILQCHLATSDNSAQNKADTNPTQQADTKTTPKSSFKTSNYEANHKKGGTSYQAQADIPPVSDNSFTFLCNAFEKFWRAFPVKQSKPKAWDAFQTLSPNQELLDLIIDALTKQCTYRKEATINGQWVPHWKHAANWLLQHSWEDELPAFTFLSEEISNANSKGNYTQNPTAIESLWESCKDAFDEPTDNTDDTEHTNDERKVIYLNAKRAAY